MSPSPSLPPPPQTLHSPPITIVLTVILLVFFLLGFFSIYFCRCIVEAVFHTWHFRRTPSGHLAAGAGAGVNPAQGGLDRAVIKSLPTFLYSSVKEVRKEKYALECAICLAEFNDDSFLRLLTVCYHVFHQDCIDLWLESHKTCPVCRRDLDTPNLFAAKSPDDNNNNRPSPAADTRRNDQSSPEDHAVRIDIDANNDERNDDVLEAVRRRRRRCDRSSRVRSTDERPGLAGDAERFTRSHSTGHSIVRPREDEDEDGDEGEEREEEDRYTLRLPEHVRLRILRARHWTASCEAYKWDHLVARHRFYVSSDYGSPVSDDNSGALVADHPSDHDHHTTVL